MLTISSSEVFAYFSIKKLIEHYDIFFKGKLMKYDSHF